MLMKNVLNLDIAPLQRAPYSIAIEVKKSAAPATLPAL